MSFVEFTKIAGEVFRWIFIGLFGTVFLVNTILIVSGNKDDGFEVEILTIGYMIVSLLAIICLLML